MNSFLPFSEVLLLSLMQEFTFVLIHACRWILNSKSKAWIPCLCVDNLEDSEILDLEECSHEKDLSSGLTVTCELTQPCCHVCLFHLIRNQSKILKTRDTQLVRGMGLVGMSSCAACSRCWKCPSERLRRSPSRCSCSSCIQIKSSTLAKVGQRLRNLPQLGRKQLLWPRVGSSVCTWSVNHKLKPKALWWSACAERCLQGPWILHWLIPFFWHCSDPLQTGPTQKSKASEDLSSLQNANLKECLKKGRIDLMHSLKIPWLQTLAGWEVIGRDLSAPTQQI